MIVRGSLAVVSKLFVPPSTTLPLKHGGFLDMVIWTLLKHPTKRACNLL